MKENITVMKTLVGLFLLGVQAIASGSACQMLNCPAKTQAYLTEFGYLNPDRACNEDDLRAALTQFQSMNIGFEGLQVTGECDNITVTVMHMPRCGCEDIVKGNKPKVMQPANLIGPQPYALGMTKWGKRKLTWFVEQYPSRNRHLNNAQIDDAMRRGLDIWAQKTQLTFEKVPRKPADIVISFGTGRHEPTPPYYDFDGPGNVLAHAFFPESGVVHFDDDERYVLGTSDGTELYIVAAHEFGHTLGISHSNVHEALMAPYYRYSTKLELHHDDVGAIQALYGAPQNTPAPITNAPTRAPLPTPAPVYPPYCEISVEGAFQIDGVTYMFSQERENGLSNTYVYTVTAEGINERSKTAISEMFTKNSSSKYRGRPYPYRVDAAAYIPDRKYAFLFVSTRTYRYTKVRDDLFYLDEGYPKWMDVSEFPERPRAAVAMPYTRSKAHYMLIFGSTMVWDWNFGSDRVGAWAYPIDVFGRNMPQQVDAAYLDTTRNPSDPSVIFIKGKEYSRFSVQYRRVMPGDENKSLKKDIFKKGCM